MEIVRFSGSVVNMSKQVYPLYEAIFNNETLRFAFDTNKRPYFWFFFPDVLRCLGRTHCGSVSSLLKNLPGKKSFVSSIKIDKEPTIPWMTMMSFSTAIKFANGSDIGCGIDFTVFMESLRPDLREILADSRRKVVSGPVKENKVNDENGEVNEVYGYSEVELTSDCKDLVVVKDGVVMADSLGVAERFGKNHRDVMEKVRSIIEEHPKQGARNFTRTSYVDVQGKSRPMFEMTRDGFSFLVMGFTGKKAGDWKWKYIDAFNYMEAELNKKIRSTDQTNQPVSSNDNVRALEILAEVMEKQQVFMLKVVETMSDAIKSISNKNDETTVMDIASPPSHLTVIGFAKMIDIKVNLDTAKKIGQRATKLCHAKQVSIRTVTDERYETVNAYPVSVLTEIFADIYHGHLETMNKLGSFKPN